MRTQEGDEMRWAKVVAALTAMAAFSMSVYASVSENSEPKSWTKTDSVGAVTVASVPGAAGQVVVTFPQQPSDYPPSAGVVYLVTGGDPQVSPFAGNYVAAGMKSLAFKINTSIVGISAAVILMDTNGTEWRHRFQMPQAANLWTINTIPLAWDGLWYKRNLGDGDAASWTQSLSSVQCVGLVLSRFGQTNQTVSVDSFVLTGTDFITPPASLLAFGDALEVRFGVRNYSELTDAQKSADADKDGMTDVDEILAGTNPDNKNSVFAANVVKVTAEGVTIRWPCVNGGVYTLSRTSDLVGGDFAAVPGAYRLIATQDGYMEYTDKTVQANGGPFFYRIVKE